MKKMRPIVTMVVFTMFFLCVNAQRTIEFRISTVNNNLDNMDGWFGVSDPVWEFEILDGATSLGSSNYELSANCPGTRTINNSFANRSYNCEFPTNFTFRWRAYEDDGWFFVHFTEANTDWQTVNVPSAGLTATGFTTIATYTATVPGTRCGGGATVTWGITLQYRVNGDFISNTAPTSINASSTLVQTGQPVTLSQVGGTTTGTANYNWYTGGCNGTLIGTGATISPTVLAPTTYYVKSVSACSTSPCAQITINASGLGVSLSDYYYECSDNEIDFYWRTENEEKNSHFLIQQMVYEDEWKTVAQIAGNGTSTIARNYDYKLGNLATSNDQYYRLVQVDFDGKQTIYDPFYVACKSDVPTLTIYPNPNNGSWSIYPFEKDLQIRSIRNSVGRLVPFELTDGKVQLINPETGTYFVELISKGQITIQKVVVQ